MRKSLEKQLDDVKSELENLEKFRDSPLLRKFKRSLHGELSTIKEQIRKRDGSLESKNILRKQKLIRANKNRSSKNKRTWNFIKSIQKNYFPNKPLKEIRTALKNHRKGLETDIPDVAWRNPSP